MCPLASASAAVAPSPGPTPSAVSATPSTPGTASTAEVPWPLSSTGVKSSALTWDWPDSVILIAVTIIGAILSRYLLHRVIDRVVDSSIRRSQDRHGVAGGRAGQVLAQAAGLMSERQTQRTATIGSLLRSVVSILVWSTAILMILGLVGLPLAPVLASAGVGGVALGFGAQSLIRDFLSGIFMIVEDQYGVGDLVDTGEVTGTVEEVTLRITRLRDATGVVWYVRNGEIVRVANKSQGWATALVDIPVAYDEDSGQVMEVLKQALAGMAEQDQWKELLLEDPQVVGVESIAGGSMVVRVTARCAPNENWPVQRGILESAKRALDEAGIRGPLPAYASRPGGAEEAPDR